MVDRNLEQRKEVGLRIKTMRKSRGMTQEELAKEIGQSPPSITMYETGKRMPGFETIEALADVFNVNMTAFFPSSKTAEEIYNAYVETEDEPKNRDIQLIIHALHRMPAEDVARAKTVLMTMFSVHPEYFDIDGEDDWLYD